jgi:hypothetical protein
MYPHILRRQDRWSSWSWRWRWRDVILVLELRGVRRLDVVREQVVCAATLGEIVFLHVEQLEEWTALVRVA